MSGGFTPSKVSELLNLEPKDILKINRVVAGKGKGDTRIPFVNFKLLNTKSNRLELPLFRETGIRLPFGVMDLAETAKDKLEYTWDEKKKERKHRVRKSDFPGFVGLMSKLVPLIQESFKAEIPDKAEEIDRYFHRGETADLQSDKRDWPIKWRSRESYDPETKKKGPGKEYKDSSGNLDPKMEFRFKFAGNPDDKWPAKFPIESMQNRPQETEFLDYNTVRLDGAKIVYDPLRIGGESITAWNLHRALPSGVVIHEIDYFFKSGGWSNFDGGGPFFHVWVTRMVIELPQTKDFDNTASPEEMEKIREIMKARALRNAAGGGIDNGNTGNGGNAGGGETGGSSGAGSNAGGTSGENTDAKKSFLGIMSG